MVAYALVPRAWMELKWFPISAYLSAQRQLSQAQDELPMLHLAESSNRTSIYLHDKRLISVIFSLCHSFFLHNLLLKTLALYMILTLLMF
jgi:hypothetical protein